MADYIANDDVHPDKVMEFQVLFTVEICLHHLSNPPSMIYNSAILHILEAIYGFRVDG